MTTTKKFKSSEDIPGSGLRLFPNLATVFLILASAAPDGYGQLTRFDDPGAFSEGAAVVNFGQYRFLRSDVSETFSGAVRFIGEEGSVPTTFGVTPEPVTINPPVDSVVRNEPDGDSAGRALTVQLRFPASRLGVWLGNGGPETVAELRAFTRQGVLLGTIVQQGVDPMRGPFVGLQTDHPEGIATLVLDYGDSPAAEQINHLIVEFVAPRPFRVCLAQIAHGRAGDRTLRTVVQVEATRAVQVSLRDDAGNPLQLTLSGQQGSDFTLPAAEGVAPRLFQLATEGPLEPPRAGYACLESEFPVTANALYRVFDADDRLVSEAGVQSAEGSTLFFVPFEQRPSQGLETGIALVNLTDSQNTVLIQVYQEDGRTRPPEFFNHPALTLGPREHRALFVAQLCGLPTASQFCTGGEHGLDGVELTGTLLILSNGPIAVTSLRTVGGTPLSSVPAGNFLR